MARARPSWLLAATSRRGGSPAIQSLEPVRSWMWCTLRPPSPMILPLRLKAGSHSQRSMTSAGPPPLPGSLRLASRGSLPLPCALPRPRPRSRGLSGSRWPWPSHCSYSAWTAPRRSSAISTARWSSREVPALMSMCRTSPGSPPSHTFALVWSWMWCMFLPFSPMMAPLRLKPGSCSHRSSLCLNSVSDSLLAGTLDLPLSESLPSALPFPLPPPLLEGLWPLDAAETSSFAKRRGIPWFANSSGFVSARLSGLSNQLSTRIFV
mmetsp:Transcript_32584/g.93452  ORF Transcript_32584/g.93452 Transcript_32584/m.93452 type:complete len:265 (-) Transcript_32584:162-956(-)